LPLSIVDRVKRAGLRCVLTLHDYWSLCGNAQMLTNYDASLCDGPRLWLNCARCAVARVAQPTLLLGAPLIAAMFGRRAHLVRHALSQIDAFLAPSRLVGEMAIRAGAPVARVHPLPYGIDVSGVRPHVKRDDGELRVVYIGSIAWQKGVHVLVEAFNAVPSPATLTVYGDLDVFPDYGRELHKRARSTRIHFAGRLTREDLWSVLSEADVVAVPSIWYENQPLVILEAYAAGVPVLASDVGALREWVHEGRSGWRVAVGDVSTWARALRELATGTRARIEKIEAQVDSIADHLPKLMSYYRS